MIKLARFFVQADQIDDGIVRITGDDAHHIARVLRMTPGDEIECVGADELVHLVRILQLGPPVEGLILDSQERSSESPLRLTLFQGLAKGDKMDLVIQKAVELGVGEIIPFTSRYSVVKLDEKQAQKRKKRWDRIAMSAAKQSGRTRLPLIRKLHGFEDLIVHVKKRTGEGELTLLAYEGERENRLKNLTESLTAVSAIVGPEGGFARQEVTMLEEAGAMVCTLGPRILRTETAGLVMLSLLGYKWGDLG